MAGDSARAFRTGHHEFHDDIGLNFQFNRILGYGGTVEEVTEAAKNIKDYGDWNREMVGLAERALQEGRLENAAAYYRAAEFFALPGTAEKETYYKKFKNLFNQVHEAEAINRQDIPYEDSVLPAIYFPSDVKKDTIVIFGGFDSFIEEFYEPAKWLNETGCEVIMFDGPGQGAALREHDLSMTHEWEKPVRAVLDHFNVERVTLIGISLGGYLAIRAASFEPRIARVIAFDVIYDFFQVLLSSRGKRLQQALRNLLKAKASFIINPVAARLMKRDLMVNWGMHQGMMVTGTKSPYAFLQTARAYTAERTSEKVTQDVLLLAGSKDHFVPLDMLPAQMQKLTNARSITCRIFTEKEEGQDHCQVGNEQLAFGVMERWIVSMKVASQEQQQTLT